MESRREGSLEDLWNRARRFKLTLKSRPTPNYGPSLMRSFARLYFDGVYPQDHKKAGQLKLLPSRDTVPHSRDFTRRMWHGVEGMGAICVSGNIILRSIRIALVIKYRPKKFHLFSAQGVDYTSQHATILPKINSASRQIPQIYL